MTIETRSFFVGIATVAGLLVLGFGGGILMGGVLSGDSKAPNKIERQAAAKDEKPAQLATTEAQAKPVPVIDAKPVVTASPAEPPQAPPAAPPPAVQPNQTAAVEVATSVGAALNSDLSLGPEKPVALTQPVEQARSLSRREEARMRKEQRRAERKQRRDERRKLIAERRERDILRRAEIRSERLTRQTLDEDDDDERPIAREYRRRAPDLPFFRIFN